MKTRTMLALALGLAAATMGCKKKQEDGGGAAMKPNEGPNKMATGSPATPETPKPATPKTGKDLAQAYLDCSALLDDAKWDEFRKTCMADTFVTHMADMPDQTAEQSLAMMKEGKVSFPDMKMAPQLVLVNGRNIFAVALMTGTHTGPMKMGPGAPEIPATNKKVGMLFFHRLAINDENKATEEWGFMDPTAMMSQLGLLPKGMPPMRAAMDKGLDGAPIIVVTADDAKEKANLDIAKKSVDAFNAHKVADSVALWADTGVESDQASAKDMTGKKDMEKGYAGVFKAFSDVKLAVPTHWAAGDYVISLGTFTGTNDGPLGPMKATGKKVTSQYGEISEIKDGKFTKVWRFRNGMATAIQLGLMPDPSKTAAPPAGDPKKGEAPKGDAPKGDAPKGNPKKG